MIRNAISAWGQQFPFENPSPLGQFALRIRKSPIISGKE
jgi:hypothetical protein